MTTLLTLYARKEPTRDELSKRFKLDKQDVVFYKDEACTQFVGRWTWDRSPPRRNRTTVVLNCFKWALKWLPDSPKATSAFAGAC